MASLIDEYGTEDGTPLEDRKCNLCIANDIGSEKHYLLACPHFEQDRHTVFTGSGISLVNTEYNFNKIMQSRSEEVLKKVAIFSKAILKKF